MRPLDKRSTANSDFVFERSMGTRPRLLTVILRSVLVALPLASCSVFEPPPLQPPRDGGVDASGADVSGADIGVGTDSSPRDDVSVGADGDGSSISDVRGRDDGSPGLDAIDVADINPGEGGDSGGRDAGPLGPWWPYTNERGCASAGLPARGDRPAESDPGAELPPIYFAVSKLRAGTTKDDISHTPDENAWQEIGFDFDKRCTRSATCEVDQVLVNDRSCANSNLTPFDGNQCRDNAIGKLLKVASTSPTVGEYFGINERDWNCELHRGGFTILFKISGYNGRANDRDIRVDMYTSTGLQNLPTWTCRSTIDAALSADWFNRATWLSTDAWKIAQRSIDPASPPMMDPNELPNAKGSDPAAFVRGGYLYAEMPDGAEFWLNGENTAVPGTRQTMHRTVIVGQLIRGQDDLWTVDNGNLQFVTAPGEMLQSFQEIGYCDNMCEAFFQLRNYLNISQDVLTQTSEHLPDVPCNGLSVAFDWEARQAAAMAKDIVPVQTPTHCPQPRHPAAPRQGTPCSDAGIIDSGFEAGTDGPVDVRSDGPDVAADGLSDGLSSDAPRDTDAEGN
jgi:hypothetical protein